MRKSFRTLRNRTLHFLVAAFFTTACAAGLDQTPQGDADVFFLYTVSEKGDPEDFWMVRAAGSGFDESAFEAARQYAFQPATCHDAKVAVQIFSDMSFRKIGF